MMRARFAGLLVALLALAAPVHSGGVVSMAAAGRLIVQSGPLVDPTVLTFVNPTTYTDDSPLDPNDIAGYQVEMQTDVGAAVGELGINQRGPTTSITLANYYPYASADPGAYRLRVKVLAYLVGPVGAASDWVYVTKT